MNENQTAAFKILEQAQQALKSGDKDTARQLATQAANLAPELEEVWLLMAALAIPSESISYLEMALQINPGSERAKKGLAWARERVRKDQAVAIPVPVETTPQQAAPAPAEEKPLETAPQPAAFEPTGYTWGKPGAVFDDIQDNSSQSTPAGQNDTPPTPAPVSSTPPQKMETNRRSWYSPLAVVLIILLCLVVVWAGWQGITPVTALFTNSMVSPSHGVAWAQVNIAKLQEAPSANPLPTDQQGAGSAGVQPTSAPLLISATPTDSQGTGGAMATAAMATAPAPTDTAPVPTDTSPAPTDTVVPAIAIQQATDTSIPPTDTLPAPTSTQQFLPTDTAPVPTDTLAPMAVIQPTNTPDLAPTAQEQASPTPLPTDTAVVGPTLLPNATPVANTLPTPGAPGLSGVSGHWFDVDLTHQMLYAYDGNTLVNSFLVSTGTWQYPTVTGQYHIYVKYRYTDMSGPGYYLPNVPFTMYFYQGYALHGTYWHHNFGHQMSHGCVNLSIPDSEWVYNFGSVGTLVNVHY